MVCIDRAISAYWVYVCLNFPYVRTAYVRTYLHITQLTIGASVTNEFIILI